MKRPVFLLLLLSMLAACHSPMTLAQTNFLQELANRPVTCDAQDCEEKWNRAIEWVTTHSQTGIKTVNERLIQSNVVKDENRPPNRYPEFSVVRYVQASGDILQFDSYCEHGFGCNPSALKLRADFVTYVMGLPPGVTEVQPGVFQKTLAR